MLEINDPASKLWGEPDHETLDQELFIACYDQRCLGSGVQRNCICVLTLEALESFILNEGQVLKIHGIKQIVGTNWVLRPEEDQKLESMRKQIKIKKKKATLEVELRSLKEREQDIVKKRIEIEKQLEE